MKVKYFDLKNKNVFITGGGSGIGASIVEHFCEQECDVYFVDINKKESNKLIKNLKTKGFKAPHFIECNLNESFYILIKPIKLRCLKKLFFLFFIKID